MSSSIAEWHWEPDDFAALWFSDANDRFPRPLTYTSRFRTAEPLAAHRKAVRESYDADETELLTLAFHTLEKSELRIEIHGESSILGKGRPREYRIVGARTSHHAVLLTQTAADNVHGDIKCRLFGTEQLASRLAHIVPKAPPGRAGTQTFHRDDLRSPEQRGSTRNSPQERFRRLVGGPIDGGGSAWLRTDYLHSRPDPWYATEWFDATGDGRYLQQRTREHVTIRPAATTDLAACFTGWIDRALQRLREEAKPW